MIVKITLSVEDTCKLLSLVNQASLAFSSAAVTYPPSLSTYDENMRKYEDAQRIHDLIAEQAAASCS